MYKLDVRFTVTVEEFDNQPAAAEEEASTPVEQPESPSAAVEFGPQPAIEPGGVLDDWALGDPGGDNVPVAPSPDMSDHHFPVRDQEKPWFLPKKKLGEYQAVYKGIDVDQELHKAKLWLLEDDKRWKTGQGMGRYLNHWLNRAEAAPVLASREEFLEG